MNFQVTVRHGGSRLRYHTFVVEAADGKAALLAAADALPPEIAPDTNLIEIRVAVDPDARSYVEEGQTS